MKTGEEEKNCLIIRRIILLCKLQINIYNNAVHWVEAENERQKKQWDRDRERESESGAHLNGNDIKS